MGDLNRSYELRQNIPMQPPCCNVGIGRSTSLRAARSRPAHAGFVGADHRRIGDFTSSARGIYVQCADEHGAY